MLARPISQFLKLLALAGDDVGRRAGDKAFVGEFVFLSDDLPLQSFELLLVACNLGRNVDMLSQVDKHVATR